MTVRSVLQTWRSAFTKRLALPANFQLPVQLQTASALLARLSPREQRFVYAAGFILGGTLLYALMLEPLWQLHTDMTARVAAKERELQEVVKLQREYLAAKTEVERVQSAAGPGFSPVSFLENLTNNTVGQDKVLAITPVGQERQAGITLETIELKLGGVSLREIVDLLYKIDSTGAMLHPTRLSIKKRFKDPYTFDVFLTTQAINAR